MKTVEEVRRERLLLLLKEYGTLVAINEKIGLTKRDSTLSQIVNSAKNSRTGKGKEMGSPMARKLEAACGKAPGWMDTDPDLLGGTAGLSSEAAAIAVGIDSLPPGSDRDTLVGWMQKAVELARPKPPPPAEAGQVNTN